MVPPRLVKLKAFAVLEVMEHTVQDHAAQCIGQRIGGVVQVLSGKHGGTEMTVGIAVMLLHNGDVVLFLDQIVALPDRIVEQIPCRFFHIENVVKFANFLCVQNRKILTAQIECAEIIGFLHCRRGFSGSHFIGRSSVVHIVLAALGGIFVVHQSHGAQPEDAIICAGYDPHTAALHQAATLQLAQHALDPVGAGLLDGDVGQGVAVVVHAVFADGLDPAGNGRFHFHIL